MTGLVVALVTASCTSSPMEPTESAFVEIMPGEIAMPSGMSARFEAVVRDVQGRPLPGGVDWSTSDPSVAIVDSDGKVWSFSTGTATATATFPGKGSGASNGNAYGHAKKDAQVQVTEETPDLPGRVTDLAVTNTTTTSATLSFTEVDDGEGGAADYLVRFQIAPLSWGSATDVTSGSCAAPLHGSGAGSSLSCTVQSLASGTGYQFQGIAIRPTDGIHGDLSLHRHTRRRLLGALRAGGLR